MYFLYILKRKGFKIQDVFDKHIKSVLTSRFSKEFDNDFESILKQINTESLGRPLAAKSNEIDDTMRVDKDELLTYGKKTWSDRQYIQPSDLENLGPSESLTSDILAMLQAKEYATLDFKTQKNFDQVPKLDLAPILVDQRQQNLDVFQQANLRHDDLNLKDRKRICDKLGISTGGRC